MATLSTKYFVEAGRTRPQTRLMAIRPKPRMRRPRRGLISAQTSGSDFHAFFFLTGFADVAELGSDGIVVGRTECLSWMRTVAVRVHFQRGSNKDGTWLKFKRKSLEGHRS